MIMQFILSVFLNWATDRSYSKVWFRMLQSFQRAPQDIYSCLGCCCCGGVFSFVFVDFLIDFRWFELRKSSLEFPLDGQALLFLGGCWNPSFEQRNWALAISRVSKRHFVTISCWCRARRKHITITCMTTMKYFHLFCAGSRASIIKLFIWLHKTRVNLSGPIEFMLKFCVTLKCHYEANSFLIYMRLQRLQHVTMIVIDIGLNDT